VTHQSTPTTPLNPSMASTFEFSISPAYIGTNMMNNGGGPSNSTIVNNNQMGNANAFVNGSSSINGVHTLMNGNSMVLNKYRNNVNQTAVNGAGGESLPPSPQSCFNSPQGSPGPLSISPQDLNPFTSNNYETMHKKFDNFSLVRQTHLDYNTIGGGVVVGGVGVGVVGGGGDKLIESIDGIIGANNNSRSGSLSSSGSSGIPLNTNQLLDDIGSTNNLNANSLNNQIVNNNTNSVNPDIIITYSAGQHQK
jgi:hypothetical protein